MNIFYLDNDPMTAAQAMTDKHIVKMILESAQMLCTAHRVLDGSLISTVNNNGRHVKTYTHPTHEDVLYKSAYVNHPSNVWVRENTSNYNWLYRHFAALNIQYRLRYRRTHATWDKLGFVLSSFPINIAVGEMTEIPKAMPDKYKNDCSVTSYRNYYESEKIKTEKDYERYVSILSV